MDALKEQLKSYFPKRWFKFSGIDMERLLDAIVAVIKEGERIIEKIEAERLTKNSIDTLAEKERLLGLSNGEKLTLEERRRRITVRKWERGGPTNTEEFEAAMSYLLGAAAKIIPFFNDFLVVYEVQNINKPINFEVAEEYIRRNKLGHLAHQYQTKSKGESIVISSNTYSHVIDFPICGLEMPMDAMATGQISSQSIAVSGTEYYHRVDAPITGFEVPMGEGE
jgi:hypothetical protein